MSLWVGRGINTDTRKKKKVENAHSMKFAILTIFKVQNSVALMWLYFMEE